MRRRIASVIWVLLILTMAATARADAIPLVNRSASENGMVRVRLDSIGKPGVYNLTTTGAYTAGGVSVPGGSSVTVRAGGGSFSMTVGGTTREMGSSFWLARASSGSGVKIAQASTPGNVYPGDLRFYYSGGSAYVVCRAYIEDYLLGVVGYEMSNSFPLEALKAQAITARTYAMKRVASNADYDVKDTTADQVYKGTSSGDNVRAAVQSTNGMALMYNNAYCSVYYSSSNGGQTESNKNAWGGAALPYYRLQDDPYDLANPNSTARKATIYAEFTRNTAAFQSLIINKAGSVSRINTVEASAPKFGSPSKLYTQLRLGVTKSNGSAATLTLDLFGGAASALGISLSNLKNELFTVEAVSGGFTLTARRYGHGVGLSQYGAQQMANTGYDYLSIMGFYFPGATLVRHSYTASLLSGGAVAAANGASAESAAAASNSISAVVSLNDPTSRLNLRKSPKPTADVLAKIPNGSTIQVQSADTSGWLKAAYGGATGYIMTQFVKYSSDGAVSLPNPAAAPDADTTAQAAAPSTAAPSQVIGVGTVTLESTTGNLNVRQSPSDKSMIVAKVPAGSRVEVYALSGSWAEVRYNGKRGYAAARYINMKGAASESAPAATAVTASASSASGSASSAARVNTESGEGNVYLRAKANKNATILDRVPHGSQVAVLNRDGSWAKVTYKGRTGYILADYLVFV
ncbi:MAG: SpoIID/LytB domain-containing protein [Oscillospiraceae bacterium]|jgi:SpoIID/LytB domain protein|nr:SpoIID/LytB domain-containing protein [Oscillospiraceae bacterium]